MGPVFLFAVSVVVFLVGPGASEGGLLRMVGEIARQMLVEKFRAIITIEAFQREWQQVLDDLNLLQDTLRAFIPGSPAFSPAGDDVRHRQAPYEIAGQRIAAMCHGISFDEAGLGFAPVMGTDWNLGFQQRPGVGAGQAFGYWTRKGLSKRSRVAAETFSKSARTLSAKRPY